MAGLTFSLITPEKITFQRTGINSVTIPTTTGEITILPGHIPLVSQIGHGELIIRDDSEHFFALSGGFVSVANDAVDILAESAIHADEIDLEQAEAARARATKLREEAVGEQAIAEASAALERALTQLRVANRKRRHRV